MKYKPGDKFIIEIGEPAGEIFGETVYSVKGTTGAKAALNDQQLDYLTPYDPGTQEDRDKAYLSGLEDAFEAVKTMETQIATDELRKMFPLADGPLDILTTLEILQMYKPDEIIRKIRAYEEEQQEIRVGDEVEVSGYCGRAVVTRRYELGDKRVNVVFEMGGVTQGLRITDVKKTGRHFPEVAALLEKLKGGPENA